MFKNLNTLAISCLSSASALKMVSNVGPNQSFLAQQDEVNCQIYHDRLKYKPEVFYEFMEGDREFVDD